MTPQEIINEIQKLPPTDWQKIKESVDNGKTYDEPKTPMTEDDFARMLYAKGIIGNIPDPSEYTDEDDDFEPIEVLGEPLSEMIIRERR